MTRAAVKSTPFRLCVFDLDGTLVDTLRDIAEALNECLDLLGLPTHPVDRFRYMVGEGVPALCQRAIGATHPHLLGRLIELARPRYRSALIVHSRPYAGIPELVAALRAGGVRLAALSNKPHELTVRMVETFWPDHQFDAIQGYVREEHRKPDPHHLLEICTRLAVPPAETVMVGDTPTDVETARRAGTACVAVTWGFRTRADLAAAGAGQIVDHPDELAGLLRSANV